MANNARRSNSNRQATGPRDTAQLLTADESGGLPHLKSILLNQRPSCADVRDEGKAAKMGSFRKAFPPHWPAVVGA